MKEKLLILIFTVLIITAGLIDSMYDSGEISIQWEYFALVMVGVAFIIGIYGFYKYTFPKFKNIYKRWFKNK
jgi:hypothetical protein